MTDICKRLRSPYPSLLGNEKVRAVLMEAADEIDRLRAQVAEGRKLLQQARDWIGAECDVCDSIDAYLAKTK